MSQEKQERFENVEVRPADVKKRWLSSLAFEAGSCLPRMIRLGRGGQVGESQKARVSWLVGREGKT